MYDAVMAHVAAADIFIAVAAVADYRPLTQATQKIKKHRETLSLELERNPDILGSVAALARRPFCVGFAAETDNVLEYAAGKRKRKNLDMIAANRVGVADRGFDSDQNTLHVLWEGGEKALPMADKPPIGRDLIAQSAERYHAGR
jgi:phosphopantothenoylcysteine decarboxylase/phosphopantothenate--cysteine ligase